MREVKMVHVVPRKLEFSWKARHHWAMTEDYLSGSLKVYCSDCDVEESYPLGDVAVACAYAKAHSDIQICYWMVVYPEEEDGRN